jgi:hypothetical protein
MVYSTQNNWVYGILPSFGVFGSINTTSGPSSGEGREKTRTQFGHLERVNLNHWTSS